MSNKLAGLIILIVIALSAGYWFWGSGDLTAPSVYQTFSDANLGLEFKYPAGYVLQVGAGADGNSEFVQSLVLLTAEDAAAPRPIGGEGPATITIQIFKNTLKQWPAVWAETHPQFSNINLKQGEVKEVVVGGAKAVRYLADGLYASDNVVVAHGEKIYVFSGMFISEDSDLRRDFEPLLNSVTFIRQPSQE